MKKIATIFTFLILFSCSKEEVEIPLTLQGIAGSWQLNGNKISIGGPLPDEFTPIENGSIFVFNLDNTYTSLDGSNNTLINSGVYSLVESELFLTPDIEAPFSYRVTLYETEMILSPSGPTICIEGCPLRYIKLN